MSTVYVQRGLPKTIAVAAALAGAFVAAMAMLKPAKAQEVVAVNVDQARLVRVPATTSTLVIGNPSIADVSVQAGGVLVVTGKGYGATNLLALDRNGSIVAEKTLQVSSPKEDVVTVHRGTARETYSCAANCEPRVTLGDSPGFFDPASAQTNARNSQAQGAGGQAGAAAPAPR